jgi:hypothetical protein
MERRDQRDCVTREELARLFDAAFAQWSADDQDDAGRRRTPRVAVRDAKPIIVASYAKEGRTVELNGAARILDISADGLGLLWAEPLPVGARVCLEFGDCDGESQGIATVARSTKREVGYHIGLTFVGDAGSLDAEMSQDSADTPLVLQEGWRGRYERAKSALATAYRVATECDNARRAVRRSMDGTEGLFVVEAKLFRYIASLSVDGRMVARQTGALNDRIRNLFFDSVPPTMVNLEAGDFSAWAMLRANTVTYCQLDLSLRWKHRICMSVLGAG